MLPAGNAALFKKTSPPAQGGEQVGLCGQVQGGSCSQLAETGFSIHDFSRPVNHPAAWKMSDYRPQPAATFFLVPGYTGSPL